MVVVDVVAVVVADDAAAGVVAGVAAGVATGGVGGGVNDVVVCVVAVLGRDVVAAADVLGGDGIAGTRVVIVTIAETECVVLAANVAGVVIVFVVDVDGECEACVGCEV